MDITKRETDDIIIGISYKKTHILNYRFSLDAAQATRARYVILYYVMSLTDLTKKIYKKKCARLDNMTFPASSKFLYYKIPFISSAQVVPFLV